MQPLDRRRRFRDDWAVLVLWGGVLAGISPLMYVGRLGLSIEPGTVVDCRTSYSHGHHAHLSFADERRVTLDGSDIRDPKRCLPLGTVVEKRQNELDVRLNGRPERWGLRSTFPTLEGVGVLLALIGLAIRPREPPRAGPRRPPAPSALRFVWEDVDPALAWVPRRLRAALLWVPIALGVVLYVVTVYWVGGLPFSFVLASMAVGATLASQARRFRHARVRFERRLVPYFARRAVAAGSGIASARGRIEGSENVLASLGPATAVYRQLALTTQSWTARWFHVEEGSDFDVVTTDGRTLRVETSNARLLGASPRMQPVDAELVRRLQPLVDELRLGTSRLVAIGETLLRTGDEVEVIGETSAGERLTSAGERPLLLLRTRLP